MKEFNLTDTKKISSNTHDYDELLKENYKELIKKDKKNLIQPPSFDRTISEIYFYIRSLKFTLENKNAVDAIILMKNDLKNNYDQINDIRVEDILPRVWRFVKKYEKSGIQIFIEQLAEIVTSGPCAQGRTTRLYQFYYQHMDDNDPLYNELKIIK